MKRRVAVAAALLVAASASTQGAPAADTWTIEGRVVDMRGEPVPAAVMTIVGPDRMGDPVARGMTDGEGYFRIGHVPQREHWLVFATSAGRATAYGYVLGRPQPLRIVAPEAATVRGTLRRRDGTAVAGAPIRARSRARCQAGLSVDGVTDAGGGFAIAGVPLGPTEILAVVPGEGIALGVVAVGGDVACDPVVVQLPTTTLRVQVDGVPAESQGHVDLMVLPYGTYGGLLDFPPPWNSRTRLDASGRLEWGPVPQLEYRVSPMAADLSFEPAEARVVAGSEPTQVTFRARPRNDAVQQCAVRVVDAQGEPVVGMRIECSMPGGGYRSASITDRRGEVSLASTVGPGSILVVYSVDRRWVLGMPVDGKVLAYGECHVPFRPGRMLDLRAVPAATVEGSLTFADGRPATLAQVVLECHNPRTQQEWHAIARTATDREGRYRFRGLGPEGLLRIVASGPDGDAVGEEFELAAEGATTQVGGMQLRTPAIVEGVVRCGGEPVPGIRVALGLERPVGPWSERRLAVVTDREGRFRFLGVPGGECSLFVRPGLEDETEPHPAAELECATFKVRGGERAVRDIELPRR